jgi:hypothetical protein
MIKVEASGDDLSLEVVSHLDPDTVLAIDIDSDDGDLRMGILTAPDDSVYLHNPREARALAGYLIALAARMEQVQQRIAEAAES